MMLTNAQIAQAVAKVENSVLTEWVASIVCLAILIHASTVTVLLMRILLERCVTVNQIGRAKSVIWWITVIPIHVPMATDVPTKRTDSVVIIRVYHPLVETTERAGPSTDLMHVIVQVDI